MGFEGKVVVVAGPPCSGKGTQCKRLAERLGLVHVSTGDVFRDAVKRRTPLGLEAQGYLDRGCFVPDEIMIRFVTERLAEPDVVARGCLLDGFPRTGAQARTLAAAVQVERFIVMQVPDKALIARAAARRIDPTTGDIYNLTYVPPPAEIVGRLEPRQYDDDAGTFQVRLDVYHKHIRQIIPCFGKRVWMVDAMRRPDAVFTDLARCLEATLGSPNGGSEGQAEAAPTEAPAEFVCVITQEVMQDPVTTADGQVYEREAIETWLKDKNTSPLTGKVLRHKDLTPSPALRSMIERWAEGSITAAEALSGSAYTGPGTLQSPVPRDSLVLDALPERLVDRLGSGACPEPELAESVSSGPVEAETVSAGPVEAEAVPRVDGAGAQAPGCVEVSIVPSGDANADGVQNVVVEVSVPEAQQRDPVDICCVVDISGSMDTAATHEAPDGTIHNDGLSILDLVKHAVKTIAHMMHPEDRLALVPFSCSASVLLAPTYMDAAGRELAVQKTESLRTAGTTNIWDGLQKGLESLREASAADKMAERRGRKSTVLLLTDGVPNNVPSGGHHAVLQNYITSHPEFSFQISTFGFGYKLDSELLLDIATLGRGSYGFIPDAKILGTVFVNALANAVATCAQQATLLLTAPKKFQPTPRQNGSNRKKNKRAAHMDAESETQSTIAGRPLGDYSCSWESEGLKVDLGPLQFGQKRSIAVPIRSVANLEATLVFSKPENHEEVRVVASSGALAPSPEAALTALRSDVITSGRLAVATADTGDINSANAAIRALVSRFAPAAARTEGHEATHAALLQLRGDVEGRLTKSFDGADRFNRWGKHYVRALLRAHQLQLQTNFMDQGLQSYGGVLFQQVRDEGGPIFQNLPPPQPSLRRPSMASVSSASGSRPAPAPTPRMADYYEGSGGGCFGSGSTVLVARPGDALKNNDGFVRTDVTAVQPGDFVRVAGGGSAEVACVARIAEPAGATLCELPSGLRITAKHPIRMNGQWQLPSARPEARTVQNADGFVVNFVLRGGDGRTYDHGHVLLIDGVECAAWGHGLKGEVIGDAFWGSEKVVDAVTAVSSDAGHVDLRGCVRNANGAVVGFA